MALQTFTLQPSADIHLILQPAASKTLQVQVKGYDDQANFPGPINNDCSFSIADSSIATVNAAGLLTAVKEGITFLKVTHKVASLNLELVARVRVHPSVFGFLLGNKSGSVHAGLDDFQPTLYGDFTGEIEDVTGHPYFKYTSLSPTIFSVDAASGRVKGIAPGTGKLRMEDILKNQLIGEIDITVKASLDTERRIVEKVTMKGLGPDKRNILFLAEGFKATEEQKFRDVVRKIDDRMRSSVLHEPYKILSNDYNTWLAFEASIESGVTIANLLRLDNNADFAFAVANIRRAAPTNIYSLYELIDFVGLPTARQRDRGGYTMAVANGEWASITGYDKNKLDQAMFDAWQDCFFNTRTFDKNSTFGLTYSQRPGDRVAGNIGSVKMDNSWYLAQGAALDFFNADPRRLPFEHFPGNVFDSTLNITKHWSKTFFDYFKSLTIKTGVDSANPNYHIGQKWDHDGDDQGFVLIVVNDEVLAGNYKILPNSFGALSLGRADAIQNVSFTNTGGQVEDHTPDTDKYFIEPVTATAIHELSHAMGLGDEYESFRGKARTLSDAPTVTADLILVELDSNLNSIAQIKQDGSKWEALLRMEKSSALVEESPAVSATKTLDIKLFPGEGKKWKVNDEAALLTKNLNKEAAFTLYPKYRAHAIDGGVVKITAKSGDSLTLSSTSLTPGNKFPKGSILFFPKMFNGSILNIMLPGVMNLLNNGSGSFPNSVHKIDLTKILGLKTDCSIDNQNLIPTPSSIPNVTLPSKKHQLLAMYMGGGGYNCGVVRPTSACKMRSEWINGHGHVRFCHICKYMIVQEFNPSKHHQLDDIYPGSPK